MEDTFLIVLFCWALILLPSITVLVYDFIIDINGN
jgi:hypothetical protein